MRDASAPKPKLTAETCNVHSVVVLFSYFFLCADLKFWLNVLHQTNFDDWEHVVFLKKLIKQKCFEFCCIHYQIYLIQQIWSNYFDRVLSAIVHWLIGLTNSQ